MRMLALGLGVIVGLVALAPARLLLPAPPLAATSVTGSLWQAQLSGAALGRMQLGDVALALQPGALLKGRLSWQAAGSLNGQIWRGFTAGGVTGLNGRLTGSPLPGLPLAGQRQLAGTPRCDGAALLLPLASGDGRVRLDVTIAAGRWTARLAVSGAGVGEAAALTAAGFRAQGGALVKEDSGA
jgi:general secretion pathway protein N